MSTNKINIINDYTEINEEIEEFYVSVDIEANGSHPGMYSMSSLGAYIAGIRTKSGNYFNLSHHNKEHVFYAELEPINLNYDHDAILVGGLRNFDAKEFKDDSVAEAEARFNWSCKNGLSPEYVMNNFANFVNNYVQKTSARAVFIAYPASFDWMFVYWYFQEYGITSPFGFSGVIDLKTLNIAKFNRTMRKATKRNMPNRIQHAAPSDVQHTHFADDDAIEQGYMGMELFRE